MSVEVRFLLFLFSAIGFTQIVVDSDFIAIKWFKQLMCNILHSEIYKVFECSMCLGFWTGMFCGYHLLTHSPVLVFLCGCAGSFSSTLATLFMEYLTANSVVSIDE